MRVFGISSVKIFILNHVHAFQHSFLYPVSVHLKREFRFVKEVNCAALRRADHR